MIWPLLLVLGIGVFLLVKARTPGWKMLGWVLIVIVALLLMLMRGLFWRADSG